jgi:hypothetical protein
VGYYAWWSLGLNIGTLLSLLDWLSSEKRAKNICTYGNSDNIHRRFNRENHPVVRDGAPERDGNTTLRLLRSIKKNALIFGYFDASVCRWFRARLTRSAI